jgi:phage terminase large subunit-like protein
VYIIASTAGSRVVVGASVAGVSVVGASVVDDSVVGATDAIDAESPPPHADRAIAAKREVRRSG